LALEICHNSLTYFQNDPSTLPTALGATVAVGQIKKSFGNLAARAFFASNVVAWDGSLRQRKLPFVE
jgi:hypothetical protein